MNQEEKISIIIPAYNSEKTIEQAVKSVLDQTYKNLQVIVIDDGSTDNTCEVMQELTKHDERLVFLQNKENSGVAYSRNRGLDFATGDYIAFLDSDDTWDERKLEKQIIAMKNYNADLCCCSYAIVSENGNKIAADYITSETISFKSMLCENQVGCSTVIFTKELAKRYRFNEKYYHEDYVLWMQLLKDGYRIVGLKDVLVNWRYIQTSKSFNKFKCARNRWEILHKYLQLSIPKSIYCMSKYMLAGLRKYRVKKVS